MSEIQLRCLCNACGELLDPLSSEFLPITIHLQPEKGSKAEKTINSKSPLHLNVHCECWNKLQGDSKGIKLSCAPPGEEKLSMICQTGPEEILNAALVELEKNRGDANLPGCECGHCEPNGGVHCMNRLAYRMVETARTVISYQEANWGPS